MVKGWLDTSDIDLKTKKLENQAAKINNELATQESKARVLFSYVRQVGSLLLSNVKQTALVQTAQSALQVLSVQQQVASLRIRMAEALAVNNYPAVALLGVLIGSAEYQLAESIVTQQRAREQQEYTRQINEMTDMYS